MTPRLERARRAVVNGARLIRSSLTAPRRTRPEPLVTVILATYNWSGVLRHAVTSVLEQTHENLELIVVGDACTDDSEAVVRAFGDPRVRWDNLADNSGNQAEPNNRGLALAGGELIAYQGHDDLWHPHHLATLVDAMTSTGADVAWTAAEILGPPGSRIRAFSGKVFRGRREPREGIPPCTLMHRRSLIGRVGPWPDWREEVLSPDVELLDRAQRAGTRLLAVPALTAVKFPSVLRPNCYIEKPSHEQAEYLRRIRSRRAFRIREVAATLLGRALGLYRAPPPEALTAGPEGPGERTTKTRRIRGLE